MSSGSTDHDPDGSIDYVRVHRELQRGLEHVDETCRTLGIEYWLDAGTLLGAVRHKDFIPWDDDIDLCMTRENLKRFVAEAPAHLGPAYSVQTPKNDRAIGVDTKIYVARTHVKGRGAAIHGLRPTQHDGLYIDILLADPLAQSRSVRRVERSLAWLVRTHAWSRQMARSRNVSRTQRLRWCLASLVPRWVVRMAERLLEHRIRSHDRSLYGIGPAALFNGVAYDRAIILPLAEGTFAGLTVPVPARPHDYLVGQYGENYMQLPPVEQRVPHAEMVWFDE